MKKLFYDLHIHSCLSPCGDQLMTPGNIVGMAKVCGLDVIAITDHNSCGNVAAAIHHGNVHDIIVIPAMELTTAEEVHVLCYFPNLESALSFSDFVYAKLPKINNREDIFGKQEYCNTDDIAVRTEPNLLINATTIPFDTLADLLSSYNGIMVPAHIDKASYSLLSNLGFVPPDSSFNTFEIYDISCLSKLKDQNPYLKNCKFIHNSDAHILESINGQVNFLEPQEMSVPSILSELNKKSGT